MRDLRYLNRLTEFFSSEYQKLVRFVRYKIESISEMDAEDFVQEVAVNLFKHADVGAPIENLSAYVYRSLQNQIVDAFRKQKQLISLDQPLMDSDTATLADVIKSDILNKKTDQHTHEIEEELFSLLDCLSEEERALVIATELEGYTFKELVEIWQVPLNTLLSKKSRAIKKLMSIAAQK